MTYCLEGSCCCPTELILHKLYGCFAVSKHYHRTRADFETCALPYTIALILTGPRKHYAAISLKEFQVDPSEPICSSICIDGGGSCRARSCDILLNRQALYQLS